MAIEEFAPAKVNLALHVTGRRDDGYHLLDSLVVFADIGDRVAASTADRLTLEVGGPMAASVPQSDDNLMLRAAALFGDAPGARLQLTKALPVAAGIGGGSADAAATLRALARLWGRALPASDAVLSLGADVPVCLNGRPARMSGIGEDLQPVPDLPAAWLVLVNPGVSVATGKVFAGLTTRDNQPMEDLPAGFTGFQALASWLARQENDLEGPATAVAPDIGDVLARLRATGDVALARMSGSGATCFGLCADRQSASRAAAAIGEARPDWWVAAAPMLS